MLSIGIVVLTLSTYSTRRFGSMLLLCVVLGVGIVAGTKWSINILSPKTVVVTTQHFAPEIGNLTLSATIVSKKEVLLNLSFWGTSYTMKPGHVWTLWISDTFVGLADTARLPEGLKLVEGNLLWNGTYPVAYYFASVQVRALAIEDGIWTVYGAFGATHGAGWYVGISTGGIEITVSQGNVMQLEKE